MKISKETKKWMEANDGYFKIDNKKSISIGRGSK